MKYFTLLELHARIQAIKPEEIIAPEQVCPLNAEVLGPATFFLKQIFTLFQQLNDAYELSPEGQEVVRLTRYAASNEARSLPSEERIMLGEKLEDLQGQLSPMSTMIDVVWMYFLAEAALVFPSDAYLYHEVWVYSDWSVAVSIPEEEVPEETLETDDQASIFREARAPTRDKYH